jgi:hypothetical protein
MTLGGDSVIGYFAYRSRLDVVCVDGDACLIGASEMAMKAYVTEFDSANAAGATIRKTRFREIFRGLRLGAAYAFDESAYSRFYPLALEAGLPVSIADFEAAKADGSRFFTVRLTDKAGDGRP